MPGKQTPKNDCELTPYKGPAASRSQREMWEHNQGLRFSHEAGNCVPNSKQFLMWNSGFQSNGGLAGKSIRSRAWHRETLGGTYPQFREMVRNTGNSKGCQISCLYCFPGGPDGKASACNDWAASLHFTSLHFTSLHACVSHCFSSHQKFTGVTPPSSLLKYEIQLSKFKHLTNFVQWFVSLTQWTWVWAIWGSWWWTGKPGMLQSPGLQRVGHDWVTELNWFFNVVLFCMEAS